MSPGRQRQGLALLLKRAEHRIHQRLQPGLDELGISLGHWRVMSVLAAEPGTAMVVLADAAVLPAASLTRHVDRLVEQGLVVRRIDPADRRRVVAALSAAGQVVADRLRAEEDAIEAELAETMGPERWRLLTEQLSGLGRA